MRFVITLYERAECLQTYGCLAYAVLGSRARMYMLIEEQSIFSIYGRTRNIHRDGVRCKRYARV